jgi:hypothetical protein
LKTTNHGGHRPGRKPRGAPKAKGIWCGQIPAEQRAYILSRLTPAQRLAALMTAALVRTAQQKDERCI